MISWVITTIIVLIVIALMVGFLSLLDKFDLEITFLEILFWVLIIVLFVFIVVLIHEIIF